MAQGKPSIWQRIAAHWKLGLAVVVLLFVVGTGATAHFAGLLTVERHRGFFAPVWSEDGRSVYFVERSTRGYIWGLGWEHFSPPANTRVTDDRFIVKRVQMWGQATDKLADFSGSPLTGRTTQHYRGRIFNTFRAKLTLKDGGLGFRMAMSIPKVPRSEQWAFDGTWNDGQLAKGKPAEAAWHKEWPGNLAPGENVLKKGVELIAIKGLESYPAAILAVEADGRYRVLARNRHFRKLYPKGVPQRLIQQASRRKAIERSRTMRRVKSELMAKYRAQGANDGRAYLQAHDEMERLGYYPKSPRLVARPIADPPDDVRVFDIPAQRFRVGLYQDIARALEAPGTEVKTGTGSYLKYADDTTGPELRAWRAAGNDRFAVRSEGKLYLLEVRRFPAKPAPPAGGPR